MAFSMRNLGPLALAGTLAVGMGWGVMFNAGPAAAEKGVRVPVPAVASPQPSAARETAVFAGGCFWGVQGVFQHVNGVTSAVSGFTGGNQGDAHYERVSNGDTGHAEAVRVTYDPRRITYGQLLRIYFSVAHDPTELNRQGPDSGTQYRSAIFPADAAQRRVAEGYIAQLNGSGVYPAPIVTRTDPLAGFYPAEAHHQDYLALHPSDAYIARNDVPKVQALKRMFPDQYQDRPALVNARP